MGNVLTVLLPLFILGSLFRGGGGGWSCRGWEEHELVELVSGNGELAGLIFRREGVDSCGRFEENLIQGIVKHRGDSQVTRHDVLWVGS